MKTWFERGAWVSNYGRRIIGQMSPEDVNRIVVIRHAALGDMVLVRPFLVEARKFFPNAEIVLSLVSNYTYGAPTDLVDTVHVVYGNNERKVPWMLRLANFKELGESDILFDLANTTRSRYVCALNKAKIKIGFPYKSIERRLFLDAAVFRSDFTFEAESMLHMLMLLGANPTFPLNYAWPYHVFDHSRTSKRQIVYFPFASVASKCWPAQNFYSLVEKAANRYPDFTHIVLSGVGEHEHLQGYSSLVRQHSKIILQDALNIEETAKLLAASSLVISNDTGVRNLAIALNTPTVGIFFSTVPFRYWPKNGHHQAVFRSDGSIPAVDDVLLQASYLIG